MTPDEILNALDPEQRDVARAVEGPVVVLAGAGTGKTRAITHRIAYAVGTGAHDAASTLAVTFTNRAAAEMRERLSHLGVRGVQARTFHSAALRQLRFFWAAGVGGDFPTLINAKARYVNEAATRLGIASSPATVRDLAGEIEWAKVSQVASDDYAAIAEKAGRIPPADLTLPAVAKVYAGYDSLKSDRGLMDFEDVLLLTVGLLDARDDIATQVRSQYRHFTVDEYQDVNPLQQRLLDLWLGERDSVCVVGDAAQTIYTFAGANPAQLMGFAARYPETTTVRLVRSYRCSPQIVAVANRVLAAAPASTRAATVTLSSQNPDGPTPTISAYADESEEAEGVARRIRALVKSGVQPRDIAVLYRINAQSEPYEAALADALIPYTLRGGERFFDRPEVREAITRLRGAARGGIETGSDLALEGGESLRTTVIAILGAMGWDETPPAGTGAVRERWESLSALVSVAEEIAVRSESEGAGLAELVTELDRRSESQHAPSANGVTLATLHSAKGLEWDAVFIVGLVEGTLPIVHANTDDRVDEERRLFYVGVTRARRELGLSWARARNPGQRGSRSASRFAGEARPDARSQRGTREAGARSKSKRRTSRSCRICGRTLVGGHELSLGRCSSCPSSYDEAVFDRLKSWRYAESQRRALPAYVIFTDATLVAIAETMPADLPALEVIAGLGPAKIARYGECVLALLRGDEPPDPVDPEV